MKLDGRVNALTLLKKSSLFQKSQWSQEHARTELDYDVLQVAPLSVNEVGLELLPVQEPLKPKEVEAPGEIEPL